MQLITFLIRCVPDYYKTQHKCDKAILENEGTLCNKAVDNYSHALTFIPNCYINQKICDKALDAHQSTLQFVPECYKTQEMCAKAVNSCCFVIDSIPDQYKLQEICCIVFS